MYFTEIPTPLGIVSAYADEQGLRGLFFRDDVFRDYSRPLREGAVEREDFPLFPLLREWLSFYFSGEAPGETIPLCPEGTAFQLRVWEVLRAISPGETVSYGDIARILAGESGGAVPSAQAVGGAVGRNRISLLIPCHRVIGADGSLRGYAGGLERKRALLKLEGGLPI